MAIGERRGTQECVRFIAERDRYWFGVGGLFR
jgi:hypothetical protein